MGQRKENNAFTSPSQSACGQKTLIPENVPLPSFKNQKQPGSLLCLSGKHTNYTLKTNLLCVVTRLVDEHTNTVCSVYHTRCPPHPVPYSDPSKMSPEFTSSPPRQLTTDSFSWICCYCMKSSGDKKLWSFRQLKSFRFFKTWGGLWTGGGAMKIKEDSGKCANGISFTKLMNHCLFSLPC